MRFLIKIIFLLPVLGFILSLTQPVYSATNGSYDAVVKIFVASNAMDYYRPWQSTGNNFSSGTGCVIGGNRILTNAHVVNDQTFIQVKKLNLKKA